MPIFEFNEDTKIHTLWFIAWPGGDILAFLYKPLDEPWRLRYRFRYDRDAKIWESNDEKTVWTLTAKPGEPDDPDKLAGDFRDGMASMAKVNGAIEVNEEYPIPDWDMTKAMAILSDQPWSYTKEEKADVVPD